MSRLIKAIVSALVLAIAALFTWAILREIFAARKVRNNLAECDGIVTEVRAAEHGLVDYHYIVNQREFRGLSRPGAAVHVGSVVAVYYATGNPKIAFLDRSYVESAPTLSDISLMAFYLVAGAIAGVCLWRAIKQQPGSSKIGENDERTGNAT